MNRPAHKRANLVERIARKESRSTRKAGKRTKAWRKWAEHYKGLAEAGSDGGHPHTPGAAS